MSADRLSRFQGSLLGGALGDALGYEVEFLRMPDIRKRFGVKGISAPELHDGVAIISDDTQMALYTVAGLLSQDGEGLWPAYLEWEMTQSEGREPEHPTCLWELEQLHALRAPGNTCLTALREGIPGRTDAPINCSKGCGGIMRVAPVGLRAMTASQAAHSGADCAALTHGHPLGWLSAAFLAELVWLLSRSTDRSPAALKGFIAQCSEDLYTFWPDQADTVTLQVVVDRALALAEERALSDLSGITRLGEGWVAEETLAIALFCCLRHPGDLRGALTAAVNHDGDSDSTGAVTGHLLGAWLGCEALPQDWLRTLELKDTVSALAGKLLKSLEAEEAIPVPAPPVPAYEDPLAPLDLNFDGASVPSNEADAEESPT